MGTTNAQENEELLEALGLAGARVVDCETWEELPEHRRFFFDRGGRAGTTTGRYAYLQLADPPEIEALRTVYGLLDAIVADTRAAGGDLPRRATTARDVAMTAIVTWEQGTGA